MMSASLTALRRRLELELTPTSTEPTRVRVGTVAAELSALAAMATATASSFGAAGGAAVAAVAMAAFGGVTYSACPVEKDLNRRVSVEFAFRLFHTFSDRSKDYAGGNQIKLATFVPSIGWRPLVGISHGKIDAVDVGSGAGIYWFSSKGASPGGFDAFSGMILEPVRMDFHAPSWLTAKTAWQWSAVPNVRLGWVIFPAGFKANAFGKTAKPEQAKRIPAELVRNWAIFADLSPVIYALKRSDDRRREAARK